MGKPNFQILSSGYEDWQKFYEPQYSIIPNRRSKFETEDVSKR